MVKKNKSQCAVNKPLWVCLRSCFFNAILNKPTMCSRASTFPESTQWFQTCIFRISPQNKTCMAAPVWIRFESGLKHLKSSGTPKKCFLTLIVVMCLDRVLTRFLDMILIWFKWVSDMVLILAKNLPRSICVFLGCSWIFIYKIFFNNFYMVSLSRAVSSSCI